MIAAVLCQESGLIDTILNVMSDALWSSHLVTLDGMCILFRNTKNKSPIATYFIGKMPPIPQD